jgi:ADP-ribose pyrophosphatase
MTSNPFQTKSSQQVYDSPWISVQHDEIIKPNGDSGIYGHVHFKNIAVGIIPIDDEGNTWLIGQYRYPLKQYSWEIIEGGSPLGIDPLISAKRELLEEAGLIAEHYEEIQRLHLSNSATDEFAIIYIAKGLTQTIAQPEDTEVLQIKKLPLKAALEMVMNGEITDAMSVAGILKCANVNNVLMC